MYFMRKKLLFYAFCIMCATAFRGAFPLTTSTDSSSLCSV